MIRILRRFSFAAPLLAIVAAGLGCASGGSGSSSTAQSVLFTTEPPGAAIRITDDSGRAVGRGGVGEVRQRLNFPTFSTSYFIEATPSETDAERYQLTRIEIDARSLENAAIVGRDKVFTLQLAEREFIDMEFYQIVLLPEEGWKVLKSRERAFDTLLEEDGSIPVELGELLREPWQGFRGIDISTDPDVARARISYGAFTVEPRKEAPPPAPAASGSRNAPAEPVAPTDPLAEHLYEVANTQVLARRITPSTSVFEYTEVQDDELQFDPSISAMIEDGQRANDLIFVSDRQRTRLGFTDIHAKPTTGGPVIRHVSPNLPDGHAFKPSQAGEGRFIFTFVPMRFESREDFRIYGREGFGGFNEDILQGYQPKVSPDGNMVAFIRRGDLYVANVDGSELSQLSDDDPETIADRYYSTLTNPGDIDRFNLVERDFVFSAKSHPNWTPDSQFLVYSAYTDNTDNDGRPQKDIYLLPVDGSRSPTRLTTNPSADIHPMVSPDGRYVFFVSNRGKRWGIWRLELPRLN